MIFNERVKAMKKTMHGAVALPLVLASTLFLAACAPMPKAADAGKAVTSAAAPWPAQQCGFATQADDWQAVTQALRATNAQSPVQVVRLQAAGAERSPDIMTRVLDLGQVQVRSAKPTASISRVGEPHRLPESWTRTTGDAAKDEAQRKSNRANGNGYFGGPIDLRFRFPAWDTAFAVTDTSQPDCARRSLVFFNAAGDLIHTVTLANTSHDATFDALVAEFRNADQTVPELSKAAAEESPTTTADADVDLAAYHKAWNGITDVHQFNRIMRDFKLAREQAVRLGPTDKVRALAPDAAQVLLQTAAKDGIPIMVFLSNGAVTQVHGDKIHNVRAEGDWLVVDDPSSFITLNKTAIDRAWAIERGGVFSIDLFDANGDLILSFFGVRSKEDPNPAPWINLVKRLPAA